MAGKANSIRNALSAAPARKPIARLERGVLVHFLQKFSGPELRRMKQRLMQFLRRPGEDRILVYLVDVIYTLAMEEAVLVARIPDPVPDGLAEKVFHPLHFVCGSLGTSGDARAAPEFSRRAPACRPRRHPPPAPSRGSLGSAKKRVDRESRSTCERPPVREARARYPRCDP